MSKLPDVKKTQEIVIHLAYMFTKRRNVTSYTLFHKKDPFFFLS